MAVTQRKGAAAAAGKRNKEELASDEQWIHDLDMDKFKAEVKSLGEELEKGQGEDDMNHLGRMVMWSNSFLLLGMCTMWMTGWARIIPAVGFSTYAFSRWTMIAHHTCHGGYDKNDKSGYHNRFTFAIGGVVKRWADWFDWMLPEAWNVEHNNLHHYQLGEIGDPDLVENNLGGMRDSTAPMAVKYFQVAFVMFTWKWFYYAPNTFKQLKLQELRGEKNVPDWLKNPHQSVTLDQMFIDPIYRWADVAEYFTRVAAPYLLFHFFVLPSPLLLLNESYYWAAVGNLFLGDMLSNMHSFVVIVTNHAGDDMYRFEQGCKPLTGTFFLRAIISSANFSCGDDATDFMHGWLNYQVEHHAWPKLSMLSYQRAQPKMKAICDKWSIPYVKHNVFWRLKKTVDIMVGNTCMRRYPESFEHEPDMRSYD